MKRFVYVLLNKETKDIVAIYSEDNLAKKLKPAIESKLNVELETIKTRLNPDLTILTK